MTRAVEAYLYSNGSAIHGATNAFTVTETGGGGASATVRLDKPYVFSDALSAFQTLLNASALNDAYTVAYSAITEAVSITAAGGAGVTAIAIAWIGNLGNVLGFSGNVSGALTHSSDQTPSGRVELWGVESDIPQRHDRVAFDEFRMGRSEALHWGAFDTVRLGLWIESDKSAAFLDAGYCITGRVRVYQSSTATAYSPSNVDGYLDVWVASQPIERTHRKDEGLIRVDVVGAMTDDAATSTPFTISMWDPVRYGWGILWWGVAEGVPVVWSEGINGEATGKSLPSGFTSESPTLVIDSSAEIGSIINRSKGEGTGYSHTFSLQDSATLRAAIRNWTYGARLTQDHTSSVTTITVDDNSAWPASGSINVGNELVTYTSKPTAQTFAGPAVRGVAGYAYPWKAGSVAGAIVTDVPRTYRGREWQVWGTPIDPSGYIPGATLQAEAEMPWRGRIDTGPIRDGNRWEFGVASLDRAITKPLSGHVTGRVVSNEQRIAVFKSLWCTITIEAQGAGAGAWGPYSLTWFPFEDKTDGDLLTATEIRALITEKFAVEITNEGATGDVISLQWVNDDPAKVAPGAKAESWRAVLEVGANVNTTSYQTWNGKAFGTSLTPIYRVVLNTDNTMPAGWYTGANPILTNSDVSFPEVGNLTVELDDFDPNDVPAPGLVEVADTVYTYQTAEATEGRAYLSGLVTVNGKLPMQNDPTEQTATLVFQDVGTVDQVLRNAFESSGESGLRGTYDTLLARQGYGIDQDAVDDGATGSIVQNIGGGWLGSIPIIAGGHDKSIMQLVGGLLGLTRRAVVLRQNPDASNRRAQLMGVRTSTSGGGWQVEITDGDLLAHNHTPVRPVGVVGGPTVIDIKGVIDSNETFTITLNDSPMSINQGDKPVTYEVPLADKTKILSATLAWGLSIAATDQTIQAIELDVGPWVDAHPGDLVKLDLTHYSVYAFSTGTVGYAGFGRVIGRAFSMMTGATTLTVLIDGQVSSTALCPSAQVQTWSTTPAQPGDNDTIDVPREFYQTFARQLEEDGTLTLLHYRPGQTEGTSEGYAFDAVNDTGAVCRLTIDGAPFGAPTLVATPGAAGDSRLCIPHSTVDGAYQAANFMHDGDDTRWGV